MAIEQTLESVATSLAAIATVLQSQAQAVTALGAPGAIATPEAPAPKTRAKKTEVAAPNEPAVGTPTTAPATTPAPDTPAASTASSGKPWPEVLAKIVEVNKSTNTGCGRVGVEAVLSKFFGDQAEGKKVPNLEALGKNDDIFAFAETLLKPAAADDDLGL